MKTQFKRPIPGESLTATPKNAPYENPPEITDPEAALELHLTRLTDPKKMNATLGLLEMGIDLQTVVEGLLRAAVINGVHSIDVSLLIAPVIHEFIKITADNVGVEYSEFEDSEDDEIPTYAIASAKARRKLEQMDMMPEQEAEDSDEEMEEEIIEEPMEEEKPRGLMSREMV